MNHSACRSCGAPLRRTFLDLGRSPLANSMLRAESLRSMEPHYPLHAYVCDSCLLVQLEEFEEPSSIFSDYVYFSSFSDSWLSHCEKFAKGAINRLGLNDKSLVIEVASNDGYLLQYFKEHDVEVLGVEPAANVAETAISKGIPTEIAFFGEETASRLKRAGNSADLVCANNVLAHVPNINDFVSGFKKILKESGIITVEFPHLLNMINENQFDTIYHEHFSYLSLAVVQDIFSRHGLTVFDVDEIPTHGGSLRIYATHSERLFTQTERMRGVLAAEKAARLTEISGYEGFSETVVQIKCELLEFLIDAHRAGKKVVGYGAPAKGNTLLNYCGVGPELLPFTVDRSPHKQGRYLPGVQIPVFAPECVAEVKPDYLLILPWNLRDEIMEQMSGVRDWGCRFVTAIPRLEIS